MLAALPETFTAEGLLLPGDYPLTLEQLSSSMLVQGAPDRAMTWDTDWRRQLVGNLGVLLNQLWQVGVSEVFIDGSFVEDKDHPNDIDGYFVCELSRLASGELERSLAPSRPVQMLDLGSRPAPPVPWLPQEAAPHVARASRRAVPALRPALRPP